MKELEKLTTEQLKAKLKTLKSVLMALSILIAIDLLYFIYLLSTNSWRPNNTLGMVMIGILVIVLTTTTVSYSQVAKIVQLRKEGEQTH